MKKAPSLSTHESLASRARILGLLASIGLTGLPGCFISHQVSSTRQKINGAEIYVETVNGDTTVECNDLARGRGMRTALDGRAYECPPAEEDGWDEEGSW